MKKLVLTIALILVSTLCFSQQSYKIGAIFGGGTFAKLDGNISIDSKNVFIETSFKGKIDKLEYDFIKDINHKIYFTDSVKTYSFVIIEESGTKKGFDYDTILVLDYNGQNVMYYCKK